MEQISVEKRLQISSEDDDKETNLAKRMKPGSVTGKSVVVLRSSDVRIGMSSVLMPNTIEMAQLKKPVKGQFKRNVEISSEMSERDVRRTLIENFPILKDGRFCCAAASDNRTRLEFHGERRVWDGRSIRRKIKGNSALYILIEEEHHKQSECSPMKSELSKLGLDNDYTETEKLSAKSISDTTRQVEMQGRHSVHHAPQTGLEKQAVPGSPLKELTKYPQEQSGLVPRTEEKNSDNLKPTEGQLMRHETMDKFPPSQHFVVVASQCSMLPSAHHGSISTVQSTTNARDVPTMATSFLSQSLPLGTIMVPGGGIAVAQPGVITNSAVSSASIVGHPGVIGGKAITTASDHQSLGKTVFHVAQGQGARHTGLPIVPLMNMIVQPQLNIATTTTQQFQKQGVITTEKSTGLRDQDTQTETTETFQHATPSRTMLQHGGKNYPVEYLKKTLELEDARFKSPDQSRLQSHEEKTNTSWVMRKGTDLNTADEGRHPHISRVSSDYESQVSSDQTDSGIEITDNIGGNNLDLLLNAAEIISAFTEKKSIIQEIIPKESSIRGGSTFVLILNKHLPSDTDEGYYAKFGFSAPVVLTKVNQVNLIGTIPAYHSPGVVTVEVVSSTGSHLGQTEFTYTDSVDGVLMTLLHDKELHRRLFHLMAQELRTALRKPEKGQPSPANSGFITPGIPDSSLHLEDNRKRSFVSRGYKADDEASDDGELPCSKAYHSPVTGEGVSSTGRHLGQSQFEYIDDILKKLERDQELHRRLFHLMTQELRQPSPAISGFKTPGIPACHSPGVVTVEVVSSTGYLGQTEFTSTDAVDGMLMTLLHDKELHRRLFHLMAQELRTALRKPEKGQPSPANSGFITPGIPACHSPGVVTVEVVSSTGSHLGQTEFTYTDAVDGMLMTLLHDKELHRRLFYLMAQELRTALRKPEKGQPSPANSGFITPGIPEDMKKTVYEGSDYDADDEGSDDGEVPSTKVAGWNPISKMFSHDDVIERTGHRGNIEEPCGPTAGESVDGRFRNVTDAQNAVFQVKLYVSERFPNSYDLSNLPSYSFNAQESGARISEVVPSAIPSKRSDDVAGTACDNNGSARSNSDSPETANNPENMDIVENQLNNVDFDQNSVADKTWYADKRSGDDDDDSPGNPL